jgi:hypothetical protein
MGQLEKSKGAAKVIFTLICLAALISGGVSRQWFTRRVASHRTQVAPNWMPGEHRRASHLRGIITRYDRLPLAFEAAPSKSGVGTRFLAHGNGYTIFLSGSDATLALRQPHSASVVHMKLSGANASSDLVASDALPGKSNYILGREPKNWRTNVPNYRTVAQRGVYPGIDVVYYGTQHQLEYDFLVAPQADPSTVQLSFVGVQDLRTDQEGDLLLAIAEGNIRLHKPIAYQEIDGAKRTVLVSYIVNNQHEVSFHLGPYDTDRPLVIDPVLSYSTYLGGSNIDGANGIAVAPDGTAFLAGGTFSSDFPTAHPLQPDVGGPNDLPQDAFVAKISADGSTLLYSTYLGGSGADVANGIAVDTFGNAYVTGTTLSTNFPVTPGSFDTVCGFDGKCGATYNPTGLIVSNAFITKLNVAGSGVIYSTYLGYYENVRGQAIAVDNNQNVYVTGQVGALITPTTPITPPAVTPPPFPTTSTAFQPAYGGGSTDAFVTKFSATGDSVLYSSFLGGSNEEIGCGIAADNSGLAYVTGLTYSTDFPVQGAIQTTAGGAGDAIIAKVNTTLAGAASLVFSTYLGGNGLDQGNSIALDSMGGTGNIYVAGTTNSNTLGITPNGVGLTNKGQGDAFALKLTPAGALTYFTFLGGSQADTGTGIAADSTGNAYLTGSTASTDFPIAGSVFQTTFGGGNADAFVSKLDPTGATLIYSSYLGGTNTDVGNGIAVDTDGSAYVAGQTCSQDFPLSNPLTQPGPGGNCDAFISKVSVNGGIAVNPAGLVFQAQSLDVASAQQTVTITNTNDTASVSISGIAVTGDFAQTTNCSPTLVAGAQCAIAVTFRPTVAGIRKGTLSITDNAPGSPQVVNLTGNTSSVTLSASTLSFGNQTVGMTSATQPVTLTNSGASPLTVSSVSASGDFAETNSCTGTLPAGTNCIINVTYKPLAPGQSVGAITITDSAPGSPQSILLTGTGVGQTTDFTISALPHSSTVPAGTPATFTLTLAPVGGFSQQVALSCGNLPRGATCTFSPNPTPTSGTAPTTVGLAVVTALRTYVQPIRENRNPTQMPWGLTPSMVSLLVFTLLLAIATAVRRRPTLAAFGLAMSLSLMSLGCGGGGTVRCTSGHTGWSVSNYCDGHVRDIDAHRYPEPSGQLEDSLPTGSGAEAPEHYAGYREETNR